jgi:hypothetical protein
MAITDFRSLRRFAAVNVIAASPALRVAAIAAIHAAALLAVCLTEYCPFATTLALLTWAFLNFSGSSCFAARPWWRRCRW